jgi:polar amino acid transport system substrate-binding protein
MPPVPVPSPRGLNLPSRIRLIASLCLISVLGLLIAGCGADEEGSGAENATAANCNPGELETVEEGTLTVATDKPAFPPYFVNDDPTNGKGFESAVAYAIAEELGYERADVKWVVESFNSSFAPGPKDFDFDVNQISITEKRAQAVDFTPPYYTAGQAVVALKDSELASATSLEDFADAKIGVQIGTTSLEAVSETIQPSEDPQVFNNSTDVVTALKQGQVDAVVVDVPTAFFLTAVQVPEATTVGQFEAPRGDEWGALLEKGSPLTPCVSQAVEALDSSGELAQIEQRWIQQATNAPALD